MTNTITITPEQWEKREDDHFYTQIFVNDVLENKPMIQLYKKANDEPEAYDMIIPHSLRVVEIPHAQRGYFISISLKSALDGYVIIR